MAGKLSFSLEFVGLDKISNMLKTLNRELDSLARKSRNIFNGGNVNLGGAGKGNININPGGFANGAAAGALAGAGATKAMGGSAPGFEKLDAAMKQAVDATNALMKKAGMQLSDYTSKFGAKEFGKWGMKGLESFSTSVKGIFSKFGAAMLGVTLLFGVLKKAIDVLIGAAQRGADAFHDAARTGHSIQDATQLKFAMQAIGISGEATTRMLLEAERNRTQRQFGVPGTNMMVAAARTSGFGNVQQLTNMSKEFEQVMASAADNARQMERSSGLNLLTSMLWNGLVREFQTMMSQLSAAISPLTDGIIALTKGILKLVNYLLEAIVWLEGKLGLKGFPPPGQSRLGGMGNNLPKANAWANIGFVMQGGGPAKVLSDIAKNTRDTVVALRDAKSGLYYQYTRATGQQWANLPVPMNP